MNNYSVTFSICGYYFKIVTHEKRLMEAQKRHIRKFCIKEVEDNAEINTENITATIEYIENYNAFYSFKEVFNTYNTEIVQSFEGIFHLKYTENKKEYFCQIGDEWILIKNNDKSYVVIGNGIEDTTKYPFRIVREIFVRKQEEIGKIFMHGTALEIDGKGIAILGNKQSGKTTFFTKIIEQNCAEILSNDRIFFYKDGKKFNMDYFPIPVVYRKGTIVNSRKLSKYVIEEKHYREEKEFGNIYTGLTVPLTDMPSIFDGVTLKETTNVDLILFTKINLNWDKKYEIHRLTEMETVTSMLDTCFTPIDYESKRKEWIYFRKSCYCNLAKKANSLIRDIANVSIAYKIEYGKSVDINSVLNDILQYF